jgi:hypothetical protein
VLVSPQAAQGAAQAPQGAAHSGAQHDGAAQCDGAQQLERVLQHTVTQHFLLFRDLHLRRQPASALSANAINPMATVNAATANFNDFVMALSR